MAQSVPHGDLSDRRLSADPRVSRRRRGARSHHPDDAAALARHGHRPPHPARFPRHGRQGSAHRPDHQRTRGPLAHALSSPWLLGLAVGALEQTPEIAPGLAAGGTAREIRDRLFDSLIPASVASIDPTRTKTPSYQPDDVRKWLTTLACHLDTASDHTIRLDQLWRIVGNRARVVHWLAVGLTFGLTFGLAAGLAAGLTTGLAAGLTTGLATGLTFGLAVGLGDGPSERLAWRVPGRSRWPGGLAAGLATGLMGGLTVGLAVGLTTGLTTGLAADLAAGLAVGLAAGVSTSSADRLRLGQDETRVIRDDLAFGLAFGLAAGLAVGLAAGLTTGLAAGLTFGLATGLTFGLTFGNAAGRYACLCLVGKVTGVLPARPAVFLDWARRAGLLRVAGTGYQFRHDTYQQWLVAGAGSIPAGDNRLDGAGR